MENIWEKMQFARDDRKFPCVNVKVCPSVKVNFKHTQYHILNEKKIKMGGWRWGGGVLVFLYWPQVSVVKYCSSKDPLMC